MLSGAGRAIRQAGASRASAGVPLRVVVGSFAGVRQRVAQGRPVRHWRTQSLSFATSAQPEK